MHKLISTSISSAVIGGILGGTLVASVMPRLSTPTPQSTPSTARTTQELITDYYATENAVHVSPHSLRRKMDKGDKSFILVDVRSPEEYQREHIIGAINIPAYKDPNTSISFETDEEARGRIVEAFKQLDAKKDIVLYCYSMPCMTSRKIGQLLAVEDIYVKSLNIGWNEWRHFWTLWNHEHEWKTTKPDDYIQKGNEPGKPVLREAPTPCGAGDLAC